jgi:hypothetical protein
MNLQDHIIDDWDQAWKWFNARVAALIVAAPAAYELAPKYIQPYISTSAFHWIMATLGFAALYGIVRKKPDAPQPPVQ